MSTHTRDNLEAVIRDSGEGWLIDWFPPPEAAMNHIRQRLEEVNRHAQRRFGNHTLDLSESAILAEYARNPQRISGFFQVLGSSCTPEILVMAWRLIQGMEIKSLTIEYARLSRFQMKIVLESPYGEEDELYDSDNINDFKILTHVGILKRGDAPVFDGFYPLRVRD